MDIDPKLIEIKQDMPGFNSFIAAWVCTDGINLVVDVGPSNSSGRLIDSLLSAGCNRVDYVLLTHIHIDHCGGLARILDHYPMAKVICHEKGIKHITDPSNLWTGSLKVLGEIARMYGRPQPIPASSLIPHTECKIKSLKIIETPGHAIHHLSYSYKSHLFAGEAGGNFFIINGSEYLRPATPPRFFFDVCMRSVEKLIALENQPIYYAHFGRADSSHRLLKRFRNQLIFWKKIVKRELSKDNNEIVTRCIESLLKEDENLKAFQNMDTDTQKREKIFITNSVKGFIGYLKENH